MAQKKEHMHELADDIRAENESHEGHPRATSAARAQESWEEFKKRTNKAAEKVIGEVTHPRSLSTRMRQAGRTARGFYRNHKKGVIASASAVAFAGATLALLPIVKKKGKMLGKS